jgi:hypothetical protein
MLICGEGELYFQLSHARARHFHWIPGSQPEDHVRPVPLRVLTRQEPSGVSAHSLATLRVLQLTGAHLRGGNGDNMWNYKHT